MTALSPSSQGLALDRAPRLRRIAERVEAQAETSAAPAIARQLARDMRARAADLEAGAELSEAIIALAFPVE